MPPAAPFSVMRQKRVEKNAHKGNPSEWVFLMYPFLTGQEGETAVSPSLDFPLGDCAAKRHEPPTEWRQLESRFCFAPSSSIPPHRSSIHLCTGGILKGGHNRVSPFKRVFLLPLLFARAKRNGVRSFFCAKENEHRSSKGCRAEQRQSPSQPCG